MSAELSLVVLWQDVDLVELQVCFRAGTWAGSAPAYVTREELDRFADALDRMHEGAADARLACLEAGHPEFGMAQVEVLEYGLDRRVAVRVRLSVRDGAAACEPPGGSALRAAAPLERGALAAFASGLRHLARESAGDSVLPLLNAWP